jgi:hypothetical protein
MNQPAADHQHSKNNNKQQETMVRGRCFLTTKKKADSCSK